MSKEIKAVSVTKYYLDSKLFAVKAFKVFSRKDGTEYWRVARMILITADFAYATRHALDYCVKNHVAYICNKFNGKDLTVLDKELLAIFASMK